MGKGRIIKLQNYDGQKTLGLDCSSSTIGWGLITDDLLLSAHGHIKPIKSQHILQRLNGVFDSIFNLCELLNPTHVVVEDIFIFMKGKSQAQTITILAAFNRVAALAAYRHTNNVSFYSVHDIRKTIKEHYKLERRIEKEDIPGLVKQYFVGFSDIINKKGNVAVETFDETDGIAAAWAGVIRRTNG